MIGAFYMQHRLISVMLFIVLGSCGAGVSVALYPPVQSLITPNATDIRVVETGLGARLITYQAPGTPYVWRLAAANALKQHGWVDAPWWRTDMPYLSYTRVHSFRFVTVWEAADLRGGPNTAHIRVRRWLEFHWGAVAFAASAITAK
jgi:hypothetical protein